MLFGGGMGISLVFWSIAEPMMHYISPPVGQGGTTEAMFLAMMLAFNDFGVHVWIIYTLCGLALAIPLYAYYRPAGDCPDCGIFYRRSQLRYLCIGHAHLGRRHEPQ
ncbi:BCCT family transporter [Sporomusa ovata]|uniref:BCCT family transporter n=1 Tax=Sporomusa ovata TaxID=2378 RepID=UPI000427FB79|nr:BCCT family transporter [Sporomusa ovata]